MYDDALLHLILEILRFFQNSRNWTMELKISVTICEHLFVLVFNMRCNNFGCILLFMDV